MELGCKNFIVAKTFLISVFQQTLAIHWKVGEEEGPYLFLSTIWTRS